MYIVCDSQMRFVPTVLSKADRFEIMISGDYEANVLVYNRRGKPDFGDIPGYATGAQQSGRLLKVWNVSGNSYPNRNRIYPARGRRNRRAPRPYNRSMPMLRPLMANGRYSVARASTGMITFQKHGLEVPTVRVRVLQFCRVTVASTKYVRSI